MSPSRRHQLLAWSVPRLRRSRDLETPELERERLQRWHAGLDRTLPTRAVPGFGQRFRVAEETVDAPGRSFSSYVVTPRGLTPTRTLYYVHGGGFVAPLDPHHVRFACRLALRLRARVVLPDYPLAPDHTWQDSHDALADEVQRYAARGPVVLAGDSAGGNIALSLAATLRDRRGSTPYRMVLLSPWVDLSESTPETAGLDASDPWLFLSKLRVYAAWWAGSEDPEDLARPELSPALGDLDDLPPTLMMCGTRDLLQPGCRLLADRARSSSWPLTYIEEPGLIHVFHLLPFAPEARRARRRIMAFLR